MPSRTVWPRNKPIQAIRVLTHNGDEIQAFIANQPYDVDFVLGDWVLRDERGCWAESDDSFRYNYVYNDSTSSDRRSSDA